MAVNINADTTTGLELTSDTSGNINIQNDGTTVVAVTSSGAAVTGDLSVNGNLSVTGTVPGGFFTESVTFSTNTTITSANAGKVYYTSTNDLILTLPAPPGGTDVLAYGIINDSATDLIIKANNTATEYIGPWIGKAVISSKAEGIIVSVGSNWKFIATDALAAINLVQFATSGTYTPDSTVSAFLVCLGGSTASTDGDVYTNDAAWGGSYGEKFYASPSGSYSVTIGAAGAGGDSLRNPGGNSNFNSELVVNGSTYSSAGTVTGADYSALGGADGGSSRPGGGGGAGRAGAGGAGASGGGGGGGTGGNNAVGSAGGIAATSQAAGVYNLTSLIASFTFGAGAAGNGTSDGGEGAYGRQNIVDLGGVSNIIRAGASGIQSSAFPRSGYVGGCTIIEFKG